MNDSGDLEAHLGPGGEVAESLFRFFLDPGEGPAPGTSEPAPGTSEPAPGTSEPAPGTSEPARFVTQKGTQNGAQRVILGIIFR